MQNSFMNVIDIIITLRYKFAKQEKLELLLRWLKSESVSSKKISVKPTHLFNYSDEYALSWIIAILPPVSLKDLDAQTVYC